MDKKDCGYYAVWAETESFDEVLVSPVMIGDHLPANIMRALRKVGQTGYCMTMGHLPANNMRALRKVGQIKYWLLFDSGSPAYKYYDDHQ